MANKQLTEESLHQLTSEYGPIDKISLPRYADNKLKGYGFIHFPENNEGTFGLIASELAAARSVLKLDQRNFCGVVLRCNFGKRQIQRPRHNGGNDENPSFATWDVRRQETPFFGESTTSYHLGNKRKKSLGKKKKFYYQETNTHYISKNIHESNFQQGSDAKTSTFETNSLGYDQTLKDSQPRKRAYDRKNNQGFRPWRRHFTNDAFKKREGTFHHKTCLKKVNQFNFKK
ncbi:hypothetical protein RFI_22897 [Reticulomyxa filosa]|uniref:RRM domain-containing protein n=1 Tax=Reticulomyxa filosa TaxID=46433 RepID=X6MKD6_RETFI|nr:hypothetical protein RFI_22897 [Reticulomyxa filosa]|eukprot:ETO14468.1 hypothetical protein RFI_22897 [Reticulomyxa filosa]